MRDFSKSRTGFERVLMAVAATFLTVSAGAAFAQGDAARNNAAELAIDAAIPRPEPANVRSCHRGRFQAGNHGVGAECDKASRDGVRNAHRPMP